MVLEEIQEPQPNASEFGTSNQQRVVEPVQIVDQKNNKTHSVRRNGRNFRSQRNLDFSHMIMKIL